MTLSNNVRIALLPVSKKAMTLIVFFLENVCFISYGVHGLTFMEIGYGLRDAPIAAPLALH